MPNLSRVGIYARVSTSDQQTLPMQLEQMRKYADARGWTVVLEISEIISGAKDKPKREELLKAATRREIDIILVWKLDRFGRSTSDIILTLDNLKSLGVGFVSITESLDFTTPIGRAMANLLAVFAELERDTIRERIKAGIASRKEKGLSHGRPAITELTKMTVRRLASETKADGTRKFNNTQIAKKANISRASVINILKS